MQMSSSALRAGSNRRGLGRALFKNTIVYARPSGGARRHAQPVGPASSVFSIQTRDRLAQFEKPLDREGIGILADQVLGAGLGPIGRVGLAAAAKLPGPGAQEANLDVGDGPCGLRPCRVIRSL